LQKDNGRSKQQQKSQRTEEKFLKKKKKTTVIAIRNKVNSGPFSRQGI
jgi:hypothetical protein